MLFVTVFPAKLFTMAPLHLFGGSPYLPLRGLAVRDCTPGPPRDLKAFIDHLPLCRIGFLSSHRLPPAALYTLSQRLWIHGGSIRHPRPSILALTTEPNHDPDARSLSIMVLLADFHRLTKHVVSIAMSSGIRFQPSCQHPHVD